jgi:hypothetical protein
VNAEDLAASRFKASRQAQEKVEQASQAYAQAVARLEALRSQVGPTEHADRRAFGQALVEGKAEPASQAEKLQAEIAAPERRVAALLTAIDDANTKLTETINSNESEWHKDIEHLSNWTAVDREPPQPRLDRARLHRAETRAGNRMETGATSRCGRWANCARRSVSTAARAKPAALRPIRLRRSLESNLRNRGRRLSRGRWLAPLRPLHRPSPQGRR